MKNLSFTQGRLTKNNIQAFPKNWQKELTIANKIGLKRIEWIFDSNYKNNPLINFENKLIIKDILNKYSIKISSICLDNFLVEKFSTNKKNYKFFENLISDICINFKIKKIVLPLLKMSKIDIDYIIKNKNWFIKINKILDKNNISLCLETDLNPKYNYYLMKKINLNRIGLTYDLGNSAYWGYNQRIELNILFRYIKHIHIKDCTPKKYSVEFGKGDVDFEYIFAFLKKKRFSGEYVLQGYKSKNYKASIKKQIQFVKKFL